MLVLLVWRCGSGDDPATPSATTSTSTTTTPSASLAPPIAMSATAALAPMRLPEARSLPAATLVGNRILVAGGINDKKASTTTVWSLDPAAAAFKTRGKLAAPLHSAAASTLGATGLVMGGAKGDAAYDSVLSVTADGKVTTLGALPRKRTGAAAIAATDGTAVYVIGGFDGSKATNDVLVTVNGSAFDTVATLAHPTRYPAVAMLGQSIWVIGGEFDKQLTSSVQRIDLGAPGVASSVIDSAPLPIALSRASAFVLGGSIFVAGGRTTDGRSDQIYRIDPNTGAVTAAGSLPAPWSDAAVVVQGDVAYLIGGITALGAAATAAAPTTTDQVLTITAKL